MAVVERVEPDKRHKNRVIAYFDDRGSLSMTPSQVKKYGIAEGAELTGETYRDMWEEIGRGRARNSAAAMLAARPMSKSALRRKLEQKGYTDEINDDTVDFFERAGAVDDTAYAEGLSRSLARRGYGPERIRRAMKEKGLDKELIERNVDELEQDGFDTSVDKFIASRVKPPLDMAQRKRITDALARRGFGWDDIERGWRKSETN